MSSAPTERDTTERKPVSWTLPGIAGVIGVVYLIVGLVGGQTRFAIGGFVVMLVFALILLGTSRRSETVRGLMDRSDERINSIDLRATAVTALAMIAFTLIAFCVEVARGHSGAPYYDVAAVGGGTYLLAVIVLRIRG